MHVQRNQALENATTSQQNTDDASTESSSTTQSKQTVKHFAGETTLHGARFLFVGSIARRLIWSLFLIGSIVYCIFQCSRTLEEFEKKPFNTKITTKDKVETFPAVTLCNFNYMNIRKYRSYMKEIANFSDELINAKINDINRLLLRSPEIQTDQTIMRRSPELFRRLSDADTHQETQFSHHINEMLLPVGASSSIQSCKINGLPCRAENFTKLIFSTYGRCFTFNSGHEGYPLIRTTMASRGSGLKLCLNVEQDGYLRNLFHPSVGLIILVHHQTSFPFIEEFGVSIQPGVHTVGAIKQKKIINLKAPYASNCTDQKLEMFENTPYVYSKSACLFQCLTKFVIKECGCRPVHIKDDAPACALNDTTLCVYPQVELFGLSEANRRCDESCPQPCHETEFDMSFSYSGLNKDALINHLMKELFVNSTERSSPHHAMYERFINMTKEEKHKYIDNNIILLDIYFKDLSYDEIEQTPVFEFWNLVGTLGGNFGLFLGMSLLTILEFVDFACRRILHFLG